MNRGTESTPAANRCTRLLTFILATILTACSVPAPERQRDQDLAALRTLVQIVSSTHYNDSFPAVALRWTSGPGEYYAITSYRDEAIYFVRPNFRRDWSYNFDVVRHEMAHYAVGPGHGHDAVWRREYNRLRAAKAVEFAAIRARAARSARAR